MAGGDSDIPEGLLALGVVLYSGGRAPLSRQEHVAVALDAACRQCTRAKTVTPVTTADMTHTLIIMSRWSCTPGPLGGTLAAAAAEEEAAPSTSADTAIGRDCESADTDVSRHLICCRVINALDLSYLSTLVTQPLTMSSSSSTSASGTPLSSSG